MNKKQIKRSHISSYVSEAESGPLTERASRLDSSTELVIRESRQLPSLQSESGRSGPQELRMALIDLYLNVKVRSA